MKGPQMRLLFVLVFLAMVPAVVADQPSALSWSDLAQIVQPDWTIRVVLPDGTAVEGKPANFGAEALSMQVVRTSNKALHPKGPISIPRTQIKVVEIRKNRHTGRWVGTLVPVAAGIGIGIGLAASYGPNDFLGGIAAAAGAGLGAAVAVTGGTAGYFIGRSVDRRFETVPIKP
jgi:hypothetical protein